MVNKSLAWRLFYAGVALAAILALVIFWVQDSSAGEFVDTKDEIDAGFEAATAQEVTDYITKMAADRLQCETSSGLKRKAHAWIIGGNAVVKDVIEAHAVTKWCFKKQADGDWVFTAYTPPTESSNTWGRASWGWSYEGVTSIVKGSGCVPNTNCDVEYKYRRVYFLFEQLYGVLPLTSVEVWVSMTVRSDGTCTLDKYRQAGQIECSAVW